MNFIEHESPRKLRGGYYTEPDIAAFLTNWALGGGARRVLEPSCGDGCFLESIAGLSHGRVESVVGYELDPGEAKKARRRVRTEKCIGFKVFAKDFLHWF